MHRGTLTGCWATVASLTGGALLVVPLLWLNPSQPFPGAWSLGPTAATVLLLFAGSRGLLNRSILSSRLTVGIGLISYPLYLWHWPILSFARVANSAPLSAGTTVTILAASVLLAWLTYRLIERPIRFGAGLRRLAPTLFALLIAAGAAGASVRLANGFTFRPVLGQVRAPFVIDDPARGHQPCPDAASMQGILAQACFSHVNPGAHHIVVLWGDSHAIFWAPDFEAMAKKDGFELYVLKLEGCPPITGIRRSDTEYSQAVCGSLEPSRAVFDAILTLHPEVAVLASRWSNFSHGWIRNGRLMPGNSFLTTSAEGIATRATSREALSERIPATIDALRAHDVSVVVIRNPPVLKFEITNLRKSIADLEVTSAENDSLSRFTEEIFARTKGIDLFDPAKVLCGTVCRAVIDGRELYTDDNHLGLFGAQLFQKQLDTLIEHVLAQRQH